MVGAFFGAYGVVPNTYKMLLMSGYCGPGDVGDWYLYGFVFLRALMMGGDTLCSIERCCALLFPLRFHTSWTCTTAIGKFKLFRTN